MTLDLVGLTLLALLAGFSGGVGTITAIWCLRNDQVTDVTPRCVHDREPTYGDPYFEAHVASALSTISPPSMKGMH